MSVLVPILLVIVLVIFIAIVGAFFAGNIKLFLEKRVVKTTKSKTSEQADTEANKRLAKNPHDVGALTYFGKRYFDEKDWIKAFKTYSVLAEIPSAETGIDVLNINLKAGICAMQLDNFKDARKYLVVARAQNENNADVNYQLGYLEFCEGNYEKALTLLQKALIIKNDDPSALRILGHTLFKLKRPKEAMEHIRKAIEYAPDDKESLFTLAECYSEAGQKEQAIRIYSHLQAEAKWGAAACLASGILHKQRHEEDAAIVDFENGLKQESLPDGTAAALNYQLALSYIDKHDISNAFRYLNAVKEIDDDYKDIQALIEEYREISANYNLQVFSMGAQPDFIALCRKIVLSFFPKARVKINKTQPSGNDWVDILTDVDTAKWSHIVMFRFIRAHGTIGELVVRDFHSHLKEAKADKGICIGLSNYSEEAKRFTEARLIDLIEREKLLALLNNIDTKTKVAAQ
ncbi:MAG: tetratricopeptide repeat protein [Spirochaetaceae bacterium]|jgi:tetratricopeptide (TPR) repeat protein|nr:tetratricopeptide repeat protein [Spirochaetaceae bacterium]